MPDMGREEAIMATKKFYVMSENEDGGYPICWGAFPTEAEAWQHAFAIGYSEGVNCWVE